MKRMRRTIAAVLAAVLIYGVFSGAFTPSFAAASPVSIGFVQYDGTKLDLKWTPPFGTRAIMVTYHSPDDPVNPKNIVSVSTLDKVSINDLQADYIYDIDVTFYNSNTLDAGGKPTGTPIGEGLLYYIPQISFFAQALEQPYEDMDGGGRESGRNPKVELKWKVPSMWAATNTFELANRQDMRDQMETRLKDVYGVVRDLDSLNFIINISTDLNKLDDGGNKSSIIIKQGAGGYVANVSGSGTTTPVKTYTDDYIGLELWGIDDTGDDPLPDSVLINSELQPGSVYFMSNQLVYYDGTAQHNPVGAVTVGNKFGSRLSGAVPYAYTPIRFQITRDSANNVYFRIYKINQGSLELPKLFYEVQATTDPTIEGDWVVKKTLIDSYFSGEYAVTAISGVNPNNEIYYRVVVKSENPNDRLESLKMPYTLYQDTGRPPLPLGLAITNRVLNTGSVDVDNVILPDPTETTITVKSTDVTISWDKPLGWNDEMAKKLSYHFLLSTSQIDLDTPVQLFVDATATGTDGKPVNVHAPFLNKYAPKFRLVKYVNAYSGNIVEEGNRLSYTLHAFDLFKYKDGTGTVGPLDNDEHYPAFLLPNTVYYLQMYTTTEDDADTPPSQDTSDRSVVVSFTTLNGEELEVPLPMNFGVDSNGKIENPPELPVNYVDLAFSKVTNLDWNNYTTTYDPALYDYNIYYDIYMNSRTDTAFTKIGTTEVLNGDLGFTGANDPSSASVKVRISKFTRDTEPYGRFGASLLPNTTYYFKVKTRLMIVRKDDSVDPVKKESRDTAILPVTTIPLEVIPPDDGQRKPLAPTDFAIAVDGNGDPRVSGGSVTFTWERQESDVVYQLIRTTQKINPNDGAGVYQSDPEYISFLQEYDELSDGNVPPGKTGKAYFDPAPGDNGWELDPEIFTYDHVTNTCTLTINKGMFPNKLYYFSLKAVRADGRTSAGYTPGAESVWISIPVTTSLIDPPSMLETVNNAELGFFWTDDSPGLTADNYTIYAKGPTDSDYKLMNRSQSTIVKDKDGETYYGRLLGLKTDTSYDIRVYKGGTGGILIYESRDMQTRDGYHELEVKWVGAPVDDHSRYELAIMAEGSSEYTILSDNDLEYYYDKNGRLLPYYTEETPTTVNDNGKLYFHARIKSAQAELPGGLIVRQPLKSNTKYYIKLRAVKTDPVDAGMISYSKYIGPVNSRTEFNQDDYDDTDRGEEEEAIFLERIEELEQGYYWRVAMGDNDADRILLKGDRVVNALQNQSGDTFTVDLTVINVNIDRDEVYIPVSVIRTMNSLGRSLLIKTPGAEFLLRPDTLDASENEQIKELLAKSAVEDLYLRLIMSRSDTASVDMPAAGERISRINDLEVQAMGSSMTDSEVGKLVHDKLYNEDTGLVGEQLNILKNAYVGSGSGSIKVMNEYIDQLIEVIEDELSDYIDSTIDSLKLASATRNITDFASPVSASLLAGNREGTQIAYVLYDGTTAWQKITNSVRQQGSVTVNVLKTGKYTVYLIGSAAKDVPDGYWAKDYISKLTSKYDLGDVFSGVGTAFMPDNRVTGRELILLYEKVSGKASANTGLDIRQKSTKLGLDGIINPNNVMRNIRRQETAAVLLRLFAAKKGVNAGSLKPGGNVFINDEADIGAPYYNSVLMIVDMSVMSLNSDGNFLPDANMTRAEVSVALVRLLELTGDM